MGAEKPARRKRTAREIAQRLGASERTVRRIVAEPRADFLARAAANRARAVELRGQGLLYREIAEQMGIPIGNVGRLLHDARRIALQETATDRQEPA